MLSVTCMSHVTTTLACRGITRHAGGTVFLLAAPRNSSSQVSYSMLSKPLDAFHRYLVLTQFRSGVEQVRIFDSRLADFWSLKWKFRNLNWFFHPLQNRHISLHVPRRATMVLSPVFFAVPQAPSPHTMALFWVRLRRFPLHRTVAPDRFLQYLQPWNRAVKTFEVPVRCVKFESHTRIDVRLGIPDRAPDRRDRLVTSFTSMHTRHINYKTNIELMHVMCNLEL